VRPSRPRSTIPRGRPPRAPNHPSPPRRPRQPKPPKQVAHRRKAARIITTSDTSLLDVIDSLLNKGVVLNADIILALANVDLVYVRLSALLCAADRVLQR
jgi:hypothetical protein